MKGPLHTRAGLLTSVAKIVSIWEVLLFKKVAGVTLAALIVTSAVAVPAQAEGFTRVKGISGHGRTLTLWKNNSNGMVHAHLRGTRATGIST